MRGIWLHNKEIDLDRWDKMVHSSASSSIFSTSHYLNSTCPNWHAYLDPDYTFGFAVGTSERMGVHSIYPPFFHRYSELLGNKVKVDLDHLVQSMLTHFKSGVLHAEDNLNGLDKDEFVYQFLTEKDFKLKTQAKRMLKKFESSEMSLSFDNERAQEVLKLVKNELSKKMDLYASSSANALNKLITDLPKEIKLKTVVLLDEDKLQGGLIALEYKSNVLYLKGTTTDLAKESGGMYAMMNFLISDTFSNRKEFDFGGSRVEGVRFFNTRFNAQDKSYFCYRWDNSPSWYKFLKRLNQWRKK